MANLWQMETYLGYCQAISTINMIPHDPKGCHTLQYEMQSLIFTFFEEIVDFHELQESCVESYMLCISSHILHWKIVFDYK